MMGNKDQAVAGLFYGTDNSDYEPYRSLEDCFDGINASPPEACFPLNGLRMEMLIGRIRDFARFGNEVVDHRQVDKIMRKGCQVKSEVRFGAILVHHGYADLPGLYGQT